MTVEEFLALPDDGIERELIQGEVREYSLTTRSPAHCLVMAKISELLRRWLRDQPKPRGQVLAGEVRFRLPHSNSLIGLDVAYISADTAGKLARNAVAIDDLPVLAVEIVSPSDTHERLVGRVEMLLEVGVPVIWVIDPDFQTVQIHRSGQRPVTLNTTQTLTGDAELPGFSVPVQELYE